MALPPLQLRAGALHEAETIGAPDNGLNQIYMPFVDAGIDAVQVIGDDDGERLDVRVLSPPSPLSIVGVNGVQNATPNVSADGRFLNLVFDADGVGQVRLVVILRITDDR